MLSSESCTGPTPSHKRPRALTELDSYNCEGEYWAPSETSGFAKRLKLAKPDRRELLPRCMVADVTEAASETKLKRMNRPVENDSRARALLKTADSSMVKQASDDVPPMPSHHTFHMVGGSISFVCSHTSTVPEVLAKIANDFSATLATVFYPGENNVITERNREGRNVVLTDAALAELKSVVGIDISIEVKTELIAKLSQGRLFNAVNKWLDQYPNFKDIHRFELHIQRVSPMKGNGTGTVTAYDNIWTGQELFTSTKEDWEDYAASPYLDREEFEAVRLHPRTIVEETFNSLKTSRWRHGISKTREDNILVQAVSRRAQEDELPDFIERPWNDRFDCEEDIRSRLRKREWYKVVNYRAVLWIATAPWEATLAQKNDDQSPITE